MQKEENAELMKNDEENRQKHPCCENYKRFFTEYGVDNCKFWGEPKEDISNDKCSEWC